MLVPGPKENLKPAPNATPARDMFPRILPELTATMPEKPRIRPMIFANESDSPTIIQASSPTSIGCKYSNTAAVPEGKYRIARVWNPKKKTTLNSANSRKIGQSRLRCGLPPQTTATSKMARPPIRVLRPAKIMGGEYSKPTFTTEKADPQNSTSKAKASTT